MMSRKARRWLLGGALIFAGIIFMSLLNIKQFSVYFYTPEEAVKQAQEIQGKEIRIGGMIKPKSVNWQPNDLSLAFTLTDFKGHEIQVKHRGAPPDMFKEGSGVVVEGHLASLGSFQCKNLFVKHSEEYRVPGDQHSLNTELLKKSIIQ